MLFSCTVKSWIVKVRIEISNRWAIPKCCISCSHSSLCHYVVMLTGQRPDFTPKEPVSISGHLYDQKTIASSFFIHWSSWGLFCFTLWVCLKCSFVTFLHCKIFYCQRGTPLVISNGKADLVDQVLCFQITFKSKFKHSSVWKNSFTQEFYGQLQQ